MRCQTQRHGKVSIEHASSIKSEKLLINTNRKRKKQSNNTKRISHIFQYLSVEAVEAVVVNNNYCHAHRPHCSSPQKLEIEEDPGVALAQVILSLRSLFKTFCTWQYIVQEAIQRASCGIIKTKTHQIANPTYHRNSTPSNQPLCTTPWNRCGLQFRDQWTT